MELGLAPVRLFSLFGVLCAKEKDEEEDEEDEGGGGNKGEVDPLPSTSFPAITIHFPATANTTPGRRAFPLILFSSVFCWKKERLIPNFAKRPKRPGQEVADKTGSRAPGEREARAKEWRGDPCAGLQGRWRGRRTLTSPLSSSPGRERRPARRRRQNRGGL